MRRPRKETSQSDRGKSKKKGAKKTPQPALKKYKPTISFNETFFRALIEHNSNAITLLDEIGEVIYDSPAASGMLGYSPTEWIGKSVFQLVHPDDLPKIHNLFENLLKKKGSQSQAIFRIRHKDNHWLWIDAIATNLLHEPNVKAIIVNYRDVTQIKQAEETLNEIEERFKQVWEVTTDAMALSDSQGIVIAANPAYYKLYGYKPEQVIGQSFAIIFPQEIRDYAQEQYKKVFQSDITPTSFEAVIQRADGTERIVESSASFLTSSGQRTAMLSIIRDITERKTVEVRIQNERNFSNHALESLPGVFYMYDKNRKFLRWNKNFESVTGYSAEEIANMSPLDFFAEEQKSLVDEKIEEVFRNGGAWVEADFVSKDGKRTPYYFTGKVFESEGATYLIGTGIDISTSKKAEQALRNSEAKYRAVVENQNEFIVRWKPDGTRTFVNEAYLRYYKLTNEEALSTSFLNLIADEDRKSVQEKIARLISGEVGSEIDIHRVIRPDGSIAWQEWTDQAIYDNDGQIVEFQSIGRDVTERKQIEDALASNEKNFRTLIENISDWFVKVDKDGIVTYVSDPVTRNLGYSIEEFVNKNIFDIIHPEDIPNTNSLLAKLLQDSTQPVRAEYRIKHKDGSWRWVESIGKNLFDDPDIQAIVGNFRDITERKRAEQALQNREEEYRSLFEDSPIALWVEDFSGVKKRLDQLKQENIFDIPAYILEHPNFVEECLRSVNILDVNQAALKLYNASDKSQLLGGLGNNTVPITTKKFEYELIQLAQGSLNFAREGTDQTLAGHTIHVNIHWTVVPGYEETLEKVIVSTIDISERKQSEEKIQRQIKRLNSLRNIDIAISNSFDLNLSLDTLLNATLSELNVSAASILLFNADLSMLEFQAGKGFHSNNINNTNLRLGEGFAGQAARENRSVYIPNLKLQENKFLRAELLQTEGFVSYYGIPLTAKGKLKGVLEIFNRTELRPDKEWLDFFETLAGQAAIAIDNAQLFENLQRSNFELERRVVERTAELNKTNLELEHANRAKDEFLANMSHELRTPLNSILGLSESMLEQYQETLNENQQKSLQIIEASGKHLLDLINDILDLSKIEAGKFDYYPQLIRADDLCKSSIIFVKSQATKKNISLAYEIEASISDFSADPRRLKQVLVNLLTNAVKFTPNDGHVTLKVNADEEKEVIQFSVIDSGIGIAPEDLRRLFTPFVQVESSLNRHFEGTGLGLALVQKLTDLHGGSVEVESEVGKGSRFTIKLPYQRNMLGQEKEAEKIASQPIHVEVQYQPKAAGTHQKILLVEDNQANILTIGEYLENYGYEIIVANDGLQAIEKANEFLPAVILMDIQMPVMDGLEATRRLRSDVRFASTPIIALTALAMPGDRERCLEAGATEYMSKPVSLKELRKVIEGFFSNKK